MSTFFLLDFCKQSTGKLERIEHAFFFVRARMVLSGLVLSFLFFLASLIVVSFSRYSILILERQKICA